MSGYRIRAGKERLLLSEQDGRLVVQNFDIAAEEAAASLTGRRSVAAALCRVIGEEMAGGRSLEECCRAANTEVRSGRAVMEITDPILLVMAGLGGNRLWRVAAAGNERAPVWLLQALLDDEVPTVREAAADNLSLPLGLLTAWLEGQASYEQEAMAIGLERPDVLHWLAEQGPRVRRALASNTGLPQEVIRHLAQDPEPEVKEAVRRSQQRQRMAAERTSLHKLNEWLAAGEESAAERQV